MNNGLIVAMEAMQFMMPQLSSLPAFSLLSDWAQPWAVLRTFIVGYLQQTFGLQ
jgi:hypothetical protein